MTVTNIPETKIDHLQFYMKNNISPVHQDISNLSRHLDRRGSLYRYLGMPESYFKGIDVLEVGPGSGHNSLYVASCLPNSYDLLEPNPTGQEGIRQLYDEFERNHTTPNLIKKRLEDFTPEQKYDVVISEGWLGVSLHERQQMIKLGTFLNPGGILITTLASPIGAVPNALRRILGDVLTWEVISLDDKTSLLIEAFGSHLGTMQDMTRPYQDWVHDVLINPGFMTISVTPEMFMEDMGDKFSIYNSYPRFDADWRWYKSLYGKNKQFNERYMESYFKQCHNFYDYNSEYPCREPGKNIALEKDCFTLLSLIVEMEEKMDKNYYSEISDVVKKIQSNLAEVSSSWAQGIEEFLDIFSQNRVTVEQVSSMNVLKPVFGRELLYASAIKEK